jgi:GT2 family glycosyltransferase
MLAGSPLRVSFPGLELAATIRDLQDAIDKIFAELWLLRDRVRWLTPAEIYTVESYDPWARQYQKALAGAPDRLKGLLPSSGPPPLVSIICPTYKPRMRDFKAAVDSILAQTYANWELIIVDDASRSAEPTRCIAALKRQDKRIKTVTMSRNKGISGATNAAIGRAAGSYIALFDHDDLLAERAIEFMLAAALRTGAQMLYSDEDKIDDEGVFSEPNLKPDWNYRLLLAQNYVCHLLVVETAQLAKIGLFRPECNGAQDHDIILRLSEVIPDDKIVHVPEVLYHWRKTPNSTAASGKSKTYTVAAGVRAVQDHLDRKGLTGRVHSPRGITHYQIDWELAQEPSVTIIIPYREHIEMTRPCLESLRTNTDYTNYHVVLIDNWSISDEALAFAVEMQERDGVSVMRIEEKYNFARLNNLAVARSSGELLLFMNNDVFVSDHAWLRAMVGEMLADPRVGIVGNKLLYPGGLVQHGGVILGAGGVADHAHRALTADDPGYAGRAICAQDMSAVTAACMLCRRSVFDAVGGFDEHDLQVAFNDVDLCLKVGREGFRIIWTADSMAEHRESISRGDDMRSDQQVRFFHENEVMKTRWGDALSADRFYHRAFSRKSGVFTDLAVPSVDPVSHCPRSRVDSDNV